MNPVKELTVDKLKVKIYDTRADMGNHAAHDVSQTINELLNRKDMINIIFAAPLHRTNFYPPCRGLKESIGVE